MMMLSSRRLAAAAIAITAAAPPACATWAKEINYGGLERESRAFRFEHDIELFSVKNGLTVALAPDDGTNLVTVDVRYLVGAAEDPVDRAGMAHLVEHLTFEARAAADQPTLGNRLSASALWYNAWTNWDETHYTATALDDQLDELLQIESARMQLRCDQLDQAVFERERDVVLQEETQRGSSTLGLRVITDVFGAKHPYAHPVGGRAIASTTRDEACAFIADHYAPDRAILVISGRFDIAAVTGRIAARFGPIKHRAAAPRVAIAPPVLAGGSARYTADVTRPTAVVLFHHPAWGADDAIAHQLAMTLLGRELGAIDDKEDWIVATSIGQLGGWRASVTAISVVVRDEAQLTRAVKVIDDAAREVLVGRYSSTWMASLISRGLTAYAANYEQVTGRASWIADYLQYTDNGGALMLPGMQRLRSIKPEEVGAYLKRLIGEERFVVTLIPSDGDDDDGDDDASTGGALMTSSRAHDLQPWRLPVDPAEATRPMTDSHARVITEVRRFALDNGLEVALAADRTSPLVDIRLVYPVGTAADPADRRGLASAAADLLEHDRDGFVASHEWDKLEWALGIGTEITYEVSETTTVFRASGMSTFADWHVWRLSWLLDAGIYNDADIKRMRRDLADWDEPDADESLALRQALFGADHPYAGADAGAQDYAKLGRRDLERFRRERYLARGATLIVTGDFEPVAMERAVRALFGPWSGAAPAARPDVPKTRAPQAEQWIGLRDPDRAQVGVTIGFATASDPRRDRAPRMILAEILTDRARAVREGLGASYGVSARYASGAGGGAVAINGEVDAARSGAALRAMLDAVATARGDAAALAEDFVRARRRVLARALASSTETGTLASELEYIAANDLPATYFTKFVQDVTATTVDDVVALAALDLATAHMVVVVVGPGKAVEAAFHEVGATAKIRDIE